MDFTLEADSEDEAFGRYMNMASPVQKTEEWYEMREKILFNPNTKKEDQKYPSHVTKETKNMDTKYPPYYNKPYTKIKNKTIKTFLLKDLQKCKIYQGKNRFRDYSSFRRNIQTDKKVTFESHLGDNYEGYDGIMPAIKKFFENDFLKITKNIDILDEIWEPHVYKKPVPNIINPMMGFNPDMYDPRNLMPSPP